MYLKKIGCLLMALSIASGSIGVFAAEEEVSPVTITLGTQQAGNIFFSPSQVEIQATLTDTRATEEYEPLLTEEYSNSTTELPLYQESGGSGLTEAYINDGTAHGTVRVLEINAKTASQDVYGGISGFRAIREKHNVTKMSVSMDVKLVGNQNISVYPSSGKNYDSFGALTGMLGSDKALGLWVYPNSASEDFNAYSVLGYTALKNNSKTAYMQPLSVDTWYNLEYILDFEKQTTELYFNGVSLSEPTTLRYGSLMDYISLNVSGVVSAEGNSKLYLDNLVVSKVVPKKQVVYQPLVTENYWTQTTCLPYYAHPDGSGMQEMYVSDEKGGLARKLSFLAKDANKEVYAGLGGFKALKTANDVDTMSVKFDMKVEGSKPIAMFMTRGAAYTSQGHLTGIFGTDKAFGRWLGPFQGSGDYVAYSALSYEQASTHPGTPYTRHYTMDNWYTVEYVLDFMNGTTDLYMNDQKLALQSELSNPDEIENLMFNVEGEIKEGENLSVIIDNLVVSKLCKVPATDEVLEANAREYELKAKFYNEETNAFLGEKEYGSVRLIDGETKTIPLHYNMNDCPQQYGLFICKLQCTPAVIGGEVIEQNVRFSVVKEATEKNQKLGMHTQFGHGYGGDPKINANLLSKAGFSTIRDYVDKLQCFQDGAWKEPTNYERWKEPIQEVGMEQIIHIGTTLSNGTTQWPKSGTPLDEAKVYVAELVRNLTEDGIYKYELWNEVNNFSDLTAEEYADMVMELVPVMKDANPNIKIYTTALAGINNYHAVNYLVQFLQRMIDCGKNPRDYMDAISVHPYKWLNQAPEKWQRTCYCTYGTESYDEGESQDDTNDTIPGDSSTVARFENLKNRLQEIGCDDIPLVVTEVGWYSLEGTSSQNMCDICRNNAVTSLSEQGQAEYILRATALMYNYVEHIDYHTINNKPLAGLDYEINYGFTECFNREAEIPFEAKPAYVAISNFNALLANATLDKESECKPGDKSSDFDYLFRKGNKRIHMMWTSEETIKSKSFTLGNQETATVYDMYGNEMAYYSTANQYQVSVSQSPVYVEITPWTSDEGCLRLVDGNGVSVDSFQVGQDIGVSAEFVNTEQGVADFLVIGAMYDENGQLVDVKLYEQSNVLSGQRIKVDEKDLHFTVSEGVLQVKAMLWNQVTLRPMHIPATAMLI